MGSASNLSNRFRVYYSLLSIENILSKSQSYILSAILKYGYSKFTLEILEYCDPKDVIKREQYYLDLLKPEYNILKTAGSSFGRVHTAESKAKITLALKGELNPMFGRKHSDESRKIMSDKKLGKPRPSGSGTPPQKIEVIDNENNTTTIYNSIAEAGKTIGVKPALISQYFSKNQIKPHKKRFIFRRI